MIKRMFISLTLLGLAAFAMGGAAIAFFQTDETADVAITAGTANIALAVAVDCEGSYVSAGANPELSWSGIVPGDTTEDCIEVENTGDGDLDVFLKFTDTSGNLQSWINFETFHNGSLGAGHVNATGYTSDRGLELFSLAEGDAKVFRVEASFIDNGDPQNGLQGGSLDFIANVSGYTG